MIRWSWRYFIPDAICFDQSIKRFGGTLSVPSRRKLKSGPYGQYSMMIQKQGDWVHTPLNWIIFGWLSLRKWCMFVSDSSLTFLTATGSLSNCPTNTAPWAPDPSHCRSDINSNGTSQLSGKKRIESFRYDIILISENN